MTVYVWQATTAILVGKVTFMQCWGSIILGNMNNACMLLIAVSCGLYHGRPAWGGRLPCGHKLRMFYMAW